jgi:hypothetical protein
VSAAPAGERVRILTTSDLVASFFPQATSYGSLPGAAALQATIDDLRTAVGGGAWIDTGDFAQGSALGALSDGVWPFLALRELSIDVAVVGNHELDWGVDHLRRWSAELPFGLLAANLPLGFAATRMLSAVGVIGLSLPAMSDMHADVVAHADPAALVVEHAAALRAHGARHVVLALHDGPDVALCARVRGHVDLVLGGHTLTCHAGSVAGVPFLQPWAFGSQVGIADLHADGRVELALVDVGAPRPWTGTGAAAQAALEAEVVGHLDEPLVQEAGRDAALARAIGEGVLRTDDRLGSVYVGPADVWNQPARDGVDAFLDGGDVTLADVLRLTPFTGARSAWGGQLVAADVADDVIAMLDRDGAVAKRGEGPLALSPFYAATIARDHHWQPIAATFRDGLMAAVTR